MTLSYGARIFVAFTLVSVLLSGRVLGQDAQFSQFYASSLYLNPALAGMESDITFNTNFRSQWRSVSKPYVTNQISGILPWYTGVDRRTLSGGLGLSVYNDRTGDGGLTTTGLMATFAYSHGFTNDLHRISIGAQAAYHQKSLDYNALTWGEQSDYYSQFTGSQLNPVSIPGIDNKKTYWPINIGAVWSYNPSRNYYRSGTSAFAGIAYSNVNRPNQSLNTNTVIQAPALLKLHAGLEFHVSQKVNFSPNFMYASQANLQQLNVGAYLTYKFLEQPFGMFANSDLVLGGWYRLEDAFIASLGISNPAYTVGFSYDMNSNRLNNFAGTAPGAFELSLAFRAVKDKRRKRFDTPRI
ncbi:MAG: PorP/SprF family type IX secretion system membrane protein [Bacteroidota bacterium]